MIKRITTFAIGVSVFLTNPWSHAIRLNDDDFPARGSVEVQEALDQKLVEEIQLPMVNVGRVALTLDRVRASGEVGQGVREVVKASMEKQFTELTSALSPDLQEELQKKWVDTEWMSFSPRAEHSLSARPLGELMVYGRGQYRLFLDVRLKETPLLRDLLKMIVLTHQVAPRLLVLEKEGLAFMQRTHETLENLTQISSYWTLLQWLQLVQVEKSLSAEIKGSSLQLMQIRSLLGTLKEGHDGDPVKLLNQYVKGHHPFAMTNPLLKTYFQEWVNRVAQSSALSLTMTPKAVDSRDAQREAQIIPFRPRLKSVPAGECQRSLQPEE